MVYGTAFLLGMTFAEASTGAAPVPSTDALKEASALLPRLLRIVPGPLLPLTDQLRLAQLAPSCADLSRKAAFQPAKDRVFSQNGDASSGFPLVPSLNRSSSGIVELP